VTEFVKECLNEKIIPLPLYKRISENRLEFKNVNL